MMDYNLFKEIVIERICDYLPPIFKDYEPIVTTINKINEKKDAMTLLSKSNEEGIIAPIIYLDEMYKSFNECQDMDTLLQGAANVILNNTGACRNPIKDFDFKIFRDRIVPNLIGRKYNKELLYNAPYKELLDMAVIYRIMIPASSGGFDSLVIDNNIFDKLDMDIDLMHSMAINNMKKILPLECNRISKEDQYKDMAPEAPNSIIFVYTHQNVFGAAYMLHKDVMGQLAKKLECKKMYVIPASINYFVVCAAEERCLESLAENLYEINHDSSVASEILSNCIYSYEVDGGIFSEVVSSDILSRQSI